MIKSILIPLDDSHYSEIALKYAISLAKFFEADLKGLFVIDIKLLEAPMMRNYWAPLDIGRMGVITYPAYQGKIRETLEQKGKDILGNFEKICEEAGIKYTSSLVTGLVSSTICEEGKTVDLIIMGKRGENAPWGEKMLGSVLEATVRSVTKPVFVTPDKYSDINNILIAYDGTEEASHALELAAEVGAQGDFNFYLLTVHHSDSDEEWGRETNREAMEYLAPYKLRIEQMVEKGDADEVILKVAEEKDCDLIIMGAYGHSRLRELILGSTTEQVMRRTNRPVLLYRK